MNKSDFSIHYSTCTLRRELVYTITSIVDFLTTFIKECYIL